MTLVLDKKHYDGPSDGEYLLSLWDAAEAGTPEDQYRLAEAYRLSFRISHLQEYALKWYETAARNGSGDAIYRFYQFSRYGKYGTVRDMDQSLQLLRKAANAGSFDAMTELAGEYLTGEHIPCDYIAALKWARKARDNREPTFDDEWNVRNDRNIWYLCCALVAEGSYESVDEAHHRLYKIMRQDSRYWIQATALVGYIHETTPFRKLRDDRAAASKYEWVLHWGYSTQVVCRLADMYYEGRGVKQSYGRALVLYRYAAMGRHRFREDGGVTYSVNDAAAYKLGRICEDGIPGVLDPMPEVAEYWYQLSACRGYGPAVKKTGSVPAVPPKIVSDGLHSRLDTTDLRAIVAPDTDNRVVETEACRIR